MLLVKATSSSLIRRLFVPSTKHQGRKSSCLPSSLLHSTSRIRRCNRVSSAKAAAAAACLTLLSSPPPHHYATPVLLHHAQAAASFFSYTDTNKMPFNTLRDGAGTITITPKNEASQSGLVVICHGLGDTAEGFADVAEHLATQMPYLKFILPTAPTQPVTMNMGMPMPSWYDIVGLDERANENCHGIDKSRDIIRSILRKEHESTGLPYSRMVLAGFSQGGALSLYTGFQLENGTTKQKLAGIVLMSGYLPCAKKFAITSGLEDVPILHCHGTADPMVVYGMALKSKQHVEEKGAKMYELKSYQGLQHSVSPDEIADVMKFLQTVLPPDDSCRVKLKDPSEMSIKELKAAIRNAGLGSKAVGLMEKSEFVKLLRDHREGKN